MPIDDARNDTVLNGVAIALVDDVLVYCQSTAPTDPEWDALIAREGRREHRAVLVSTKGVGPNAGQRARLADAMAKIPGPKPPVAVLTDSPVARSVMTAFSWVLGKSQPIKGFAPNAIDEAVAWLGVKAAPGRVRTTLERLQLALASTPAKKAAR